MNDQPSSQVTNADPAAERPSNVLAEENWQVEKFPFTEDTPARGFLQLCADRRFHKLLQKEFRTDAGLSSREDYWINADAGGTPMMLDERRTPDYCYDVKDVLLMGWSAHGKGCGGFGEEVPDDFIRGELCKTMQTIVKRYPCAKHFIYFVTLVGEPGQEETVLYRMIVEPSSEIACTQGAD
jgi:hypothetical protein